uniref:Uncharacterized protein n=1 Tax=Rhizophagus irregularis (strain DAOM 181602 / DAOM 197198 / MUCL 43194) TaxID=747089 RepID=U9UER5_RHIID
MPDNVKNNETEHENDHEQEHEQELDILEDLDANTWVTSGEMQNLPTEKPTLSVHANRDISFDPPIMDKKLWNSMFKPAKKQDKNIRRVIYKVSSAIRPIDNTLRMVYASKPESTDGETYKTWLQMEQTVLNSRALILDALSFANELRREQALKATISPNYQRPIGKEEDNFPRTLRFLEEQIQYLFQTSKSISEMDSTLGDTISLTPAQFQENATEELTDTRPNEPVSPPTR